MNKERENWEEQFDNDPEINKLFFGEMKSLYWSQNYVKDFIRNLLNQQKEKDIAEIRQRIGALRQWLNEDRISNPEKMVTNEQIERWLKIRGEE